MNLIVDFMDSEALTRAVYLTLLHSLWQGAAIAAFTGLILLGSGKLSPSVRYNFLAGGMVLFVLCSLLTFFKFADTPAEISFEKGSLLIEGPQIQTIAQADLLDQVFSTLNLYSNSIVLAWFIIICFNGVQLSLGIYRVSNLKNKEIFNPGDKWTSLVQIWSKRMGIKSIVTFAESGLTAIPLTVGYFKPMILVPVGMLAAIPAEQVEAIILHELAHIKRQDYFINIFQSLVEVVFFFNPAIWWLSKRIRIERENCCDDLAIASSSGKIEYVRALISFEEYRNHHNQLSIAFTGSENSLVKRAKRIIYNQNDTLNPMEKFILTSGLVFSGLLSLAFTDGAKEHISKTFNPVVSTFEKAFPAVKSFTLIPDTIPAAKIHEITINGGSTTFNADHNGKSYKIVIQDDEVTELYVNNRKVAKENLADYTNTIIEIVQFNEAVNATENSHNKSVPRGNFTTFEAFENPRKELHFKGEPLKLLGKLVLNKDFAIEKFTALSDISNLEPLSAFADTLPPTAPAAPAAPAAPSVPPTPSVSPLTAPVPYTPQSPSAPNLEPRAGIKAIKARPAKSPKINVVPELEIRATPDVKPGINTTPKIETDIEIKPTPAYKPAKITGKGLNSPDPIRPIRRNYSSQQLNTNQAVNPNDLTHQITKELITEGLVKDPKKFSYRINNNELIVDGIKQSSEIRDQILSKMLKRKDHTIDFTYRKN
ncbi:M56 family metallopeptidase [Daejeonella lutea]|uniref:BlaR1 peptidase M56 n=1 Tax=Daejeonella lutea TaxID=572036 RepID=A0A1T5ED61_9SPHI|nr:M56 family metallopeptidase [Daejeonella lutea]SKB81982.1 BlaR1 peptidase M56 [Daejeonella lutea]